MKAAAGMSVAVLRISARVRMRSGSAARMPPRMVMGVPGAISRRKRICWSRLHQARQPRLQHQPGERIGHPRDIVAHIHMPHHVAFLLLHAAPADDDHADSPNGSMHSTARDRPTGKSG